MPAETLSNLMKNRENIRRIMAMDSNGKMDTMLENAVKNGSVSYTDDGVTYKPKRKQVNDNRVVVNEQIMKNSRMPKAILESFQSNPGIEAPSEYSPSCSVLDGLGLESLDELRNERSQQEMIRENTTTGPIDYSLLRTIINEAVQENVKKYISALTKKLLSEGVTVGGNSGSTVQAIKLGENFSFINENGDVYEATLKYKTNLNTKKDKTKK